MNKLHSKICILLTAIFVLLPLSSCTAKKSGDAASQPSMPPIEIPIPSSSADHEISTPAPEANDETEEATVCLPSVVISNTADLAAHPRALQEGTVFNYAVKNDVSSCLPWNASAEGWLLGNIYESLLMAELNDVENIKGCIAESWSHSEDYMSWTFIIRKGVLFTDASACDAHAIARCWDFYKEVSPSTFTSHNISSWKATGEYEFSVYMAAPCAYFETALAGTTLLIVSPEALELYGADDDRAAVGTAPYYLKEHVCGSHFELAANPDYSFSPKQPAIETVFFHIIPDETTTLLALINNEIDGAILSSDESFTNLVESGYDGTLITALSDTSPLWFNAKKVEAFRLFEVRKAICRFIDFNSINDLIYNGMGDAPTSLWATGSSGYVHSDEFYYSPKQGTNLLAGVGLTAEDISFSSTIFETGKDQFLAIQNYLVKQGINMDVKVIDASANFTFLQNGDWTVTVGCVGYRSATPYLPWTFVLRPDAVIKQVWSDIYNPDLYQKLLDEYDMRSTAETWEEMLIHCRRITEYL
ncbi:MAG: ABC transporter substrate-binding protein, partial [Oscillospiraceae bacterium]|nr:ABC transporter substrate-binding protein [Oscillospiraceae bacterium]